MSHQYAIFITLGLMCITDKIFQISLLSLEVMTIIMICKAGNV